MLLLALAGVGTLSSHVGWAYAAVAMLLCGGSALVLGSGWTERFRDHYLAMPQLVLHSALNLDFIVWVPQIGGLMLMVLFIVFAFAALRMTAQHVVAASIGVSAAVGTLVVLVGERLALPLAPPGERIVCGLWFALVLVRSAMLGLYGSQLRDLLRRRNAQLGEAFGRLETLASHDELTGALSRRAILQQLEAMAPGRRTATATGIALLDLDHFKQVNDRHGHAVGDEVLRRFAACCRSRLREDDRLGRYGGEEFLLLWPALPPEDTDALAAAAERIRAAVEAEPWNDVAQGLRVTVSIGACLGHPQETSGQAIARADAALYAAKRAGRNRVVVC